MSSESQSVDKTSEVDVANDIIHKQQFGIMLRTERERQNVSLLDVAESLRLTEANICALENSRIDELPGKAFTLGYIRSYTRFLNVSDELIIATYLEHYDEDDKPLQHTSNIKIENIKPNMLYLIAGLIFVFILVISIFMSSSADETEPTNEPEIDVGEVLNIKKTQTFKTVQVKAGTIEKKSSHQNISLIKKTKIVKTFVKKTIKTPIKNTQSNVVDAGDILSLHVTDKSWAKIEDVNGQRLFYATLMPGEEYQFNGQSPFNVFLGNAPAVQLSVNHQEVDLKAHIKSNNVAQITIDETATIQ